MASINKVILVGNLGKDPETRYTPSGTTVTTFSVATTEKWSDKSGERQEHTEWHRIVAWSRLGEICSEYLKKGMSVYIEGRIRTRKWTDSEGAQRQVKEIIADTMQMLGSRSRNDAPPASETPASETPAMEDDVPF